MASLFYRGFDSTNKVESAKDHLLAAASRLLRAAELGLSQVPGEAGQRLRQLVDKDSLWALAFILAVWSVATIVGGPLALIVDGLVVGMGLAAAYQTVVGASKSFAAYASTAYQAQNEIDLAKAGGYFAAGLAEVGVATVEALLTGGAFRALRTRIIAKFPRTRALPAERPVERRTQERPHEPRERRPEPRQPESKPRERQPESESRARRFDRADVARGAGANLAAQKLPGLLVWGVGSAVSVLLTGVLTYAAYQHYQASTARKKGGG